MQYTILILGFLAMASASAIPRQVLNNPYTFNVTNFYFSGVPHSGVFYYNFDVGFSSTGADYPDNATCAAKTYTGPSIGSVPSTACEPENWTFSFLPTSGTDGAGYELKVDTTEKEEYGDAVYGYCGSVFFPQSDVQWRVDEFNPNGNVQFLNVSTSFFIGYASFET